MFVAKVMCSFNNAIWQDEDMIMRPQKNAVWGCRGAGWHGGRSPKPKAPKGLTVAFNTVFIDTCVLATHTDLFFRRCTLTLSYL